MTPDFRGTEIERALADLARAMQGESAPGRVEAALLVSFRARQAARRRTVRRWWTGAAVAAAVGMAWISLPSAVEAPPAPKIVHALAPPAVEIAREARSPASRAQHVTTAERIPPRAVRPALRNAMTKDRAAEVELTSDFFPLRPGPIVHAGEFASLVRVQLPRSAMRRFGLPGGLDASELVQADVVIGQDGMASAVRFVSAARQQRH